jgi:hypothetical protein
VENGKVKNMSIYHLSVKAVSRSAGVAGGVQARLDGGKE